MQSESVFHVELICCQGVGMLQVYWIDQFHKSQNAPVPYPTMPHSEQKWSYFCSEWSIVGYGTGAFWDLWIGSIAVPCHYDMVQYHVIHRNNTEITNLEPRSHLELIKDTPYRSLMDKVADVCIVENLIKITSSFSYIDSLVQDCSNSSVLAKELLQSSAKPSI